MIRSDLLPVREGSLLTPFHDRGREYKELQLLEERMLVVRILAIPPTLLNRV